MDKLLKYFPEIEGNRKSQFEKLGSIYKNWNDKINVVSRKDINSIYERHILHSLAIAKFINFKPGTSIIDIGTGGGFPGIPLAIFFPKVKFTLVDSIKKKTTVTQEVINKLNLTNAKALQKRSNELKLKCDFVTGRAVTAFPKFVNSVKHLIKNKDLNSIPNGIIYLKGGDFSEDLKDYKYADVININDYFSEDFFDTKKIIYLPF